MAYNTYMGLCSVCLFSKEIKHPRGGQSYWQCKSPKTKLKYPRLPVLACNYYKKENM